MGLADNLIARFEGGAHEALALAAAECAEMAKRNMPVGDPALDTDPETSLRDNVEIVPDGTGYLIIVSTPYAAKQEFDLRLQHPRGGGPRFLARAIAEISPHLEGIIASKVEARFAAGLTNPEA